MTLRQIWIAGLLLLLAACSEGGAGARSADLSGGGSTTEPPPDPPEPPEEPANHAPTGTSQLLSIRTRAPVPVTLTGEDVDGDPLTFRVVQPPTRGTLSGDPPNLTYTATASGPDVIVFRASDGQAESGDATVDLDVQLALVEGICAPGGEPLEITGAATRADAKTYRILSFEVGTGTGRIELSYGWTDRAGLPATPLTETTLDLGLWDERGYRSAAGFRGWSGSRAGIIQRGHKPVFVEAGAASRGYRPGEITPGVWYAELGIAAVSPQGADWLLHVECKAGGDADPWTPLAVDPAYTVPGRGPGWYRSDFHMHGFHSNLNAPSWDDYVQRAQDAGLDFAMVTDYVTTQHWDELGAVQLAHPGFLLWPGREVITYFGHVNVHGETRNYVDYRHGFEDVDIGEIQRQAKAAGALFQVNHPTIFPGPVFENFCRGCEFQLGDRIDWNQVDTIEILTGPVITSCTDLSGSCPLPSAVAIENPFMQTAIDLWEDHLNQGHKITAVCGSDSKGVEPSDAEIERRGWGSCATAVYANALSRDELAKGIQAGHVYVQTLGVAGAHVSPELDFRAIDGATDLGMFGDTVPLADGATVTLRTVVSGGALQLLRFVRNGVPALSVPIPTDPFTFELPAFRTPDEGPLGTFWYVETWDPLLQVRTTVGNPIFLKAP